VRDLHLTHLRAVLIIDDEDVQSVLAMLHHFSGDNQDVGSDAGLLPGVDEIALIDEAKPARPKIGDRHASDVMLSRTFGTGELFLGKAARLAISSEAEALISDFGGDAYAEACRRASEASSDSLARDWSVVAATIARRSGRRSSVLDALFG
jgi:hypothetical protein